METQIYQLHCKYNFCGTLGRSCASPPRGGVPAPTAAEPGGIPKDSDDRWCDDVLVMMATMMKTIIVNSFDNSESDSCYEEWDEED